VVAVVDNASSDGSPDRIESEFPDVQLIRNRENVGFARANNQMLRRFATDYFLLLNPDAMLVAGAVERMLEFMDRHPYAGACSPDIIGEDGAAQWFPTRFPTLWSEIAYCATFLLPPLSWILSPWRRRRLERARRKLNGNGRRATGVDVLSGACLMIRRDVIETVGTLEESFFLFSEEADFCRRMRLAGWDRYWISGARVVHLVGQSRAQLAAADDSIHFYRSRIRLFTLHHGRLQGWLVRHLYRFSFFWSSLFAAATGLTRRSRGASARGMISHYQALARELSGNGSAWARREPVQESECRNS
jgi:GT2 family glycosyltransferase